ncbi:MAG: hypothetical protein KKA59_05295 [Candidatus Omnitrophica bacterium]|nr:hypothetical protein [Candidatus Omnitrophota bacterium]
MLNIADRMLNNQRLYNYLLLNGWKFTNKIIKVDVIIGACSYCEVFL